MTGMQTAKTFLMVLMISSAAAEQSPSHKSPKASLAVDSVGNALGNLGGLMDSKLLRTENHMMSQEEMKADLAYAEKHLFDGQKMTCESFNLGSNCQCTNGVTACTQASHAGCLFPTWGILSTCSSTGSVIGTSDACSALTDGTEDGKWCASAGSSLSHTAKSGGLATGATKKQQRKEMANEKATAKKDRNLDWANWKSSLVEMFEKMSKQARFSSPALAQLTNDLALKNKTKAPTATDAPGAEQDSSRIFPAPQEDFENPPASSPSDFAADEANGSPSMLIHSIGCPFMCAATPPSGLSKGSSPCDSHCPCYKDTTAYEQHPCFGVDEKNLATLNDGHCLTTIINYCCWDHMTHKMKTEMRSDLQFCRNLQYHKETDTGYECPASKLQTCGDAWMAVMPNSNHSMYLAGHEGTAACGTSCSPTMAEMKKNRKAPLQWMPVMVDGAYFILRHISMEGNNCLTAISTKPGMTHLEISSCGLPGDAQLFALDEKTGSISPKKDASQSHKECLGGSGIGSNSLRMTYADIDTNECVDKTGVGGISTSWVICTDVEHCTFHGA